MEINSKLDIVVPVYNEGDGIVQLFNEIEREIKTQKRVMIIYDFPEDNTVPVVNENKNNYSFEIDLILNTIGKGVLNAIKMGLLSAQEEMVLIMMADSSDRLNVVDHMCELMSEGYDVVWF